MRYKLLFIFAAFALLVLNPGLIKAQNPIFGAGIAYTSGAPAYTPKVNASQVAIDTTTFDWYEYETPGGWRKSGYRVQNISGCASPAYTPGKAQSRIVYNSCTVAQNGVGPELYIYDGTGWRKQGINLTAGYGIGIASGVISADTTELATQYDLSQVGVTWPLLAPNGSIGAPSYSFSSDTGSGMYLRSNAVTIRGGETYKNVSILCGSEGLLRLNAGSGDNGGDIRLTSGSGTTGNGGVFDLTAGSSNDGEGGAFNMNAGSGVTGGGFAASAGNSSGNNQGGSFSLRAGNSDVNYGGTLELYSGDGFIGGGNINFFAGSSSDTGPGGSFTLSSGSGDIGGLFGFNAGDGNNDAGGSFEFLGGTGYGGDGGSFSVQAGVGSNNGGNISLTGGGTSSGNGGNITITGGYADANNGGNVTLTGGSSSIPANAGKVIIEGNGVVFPSLTTAQRNALSPSNGTVIYNTTTNKLQVYAGGSWVDLH